MKLGIRTVKGRVVYRRPKHDFRARDVLRVTMRAIESDPWREPVDHERRRDLWANIATLAKERFRVYMATYGDPRSVQRIQQATYTGDVNLIVALLNIVRYGRVVLSMLSFGGVIPYVSQVASIGQSIIQWLVDRLWSDLPDALYDQDGNKIFDKYEFITMPSSY